MGRYIVLLLILLALAPLAPHYLPRWAESLSQRQPPDRRAEISTPQSTEKAELSPDRFDQGPDCSGHAEGTLANGSRYYCIPVESGGHYSAEMEVNGVRVQALVDTGASFLALPESLANSAGIRLSPADFSATVQTANGKTDAARATVRALEVGPIRLEDVEALVLHDDALPSPLLGMSVLRRLSRFAFQGETLVLIQ